MELVVEEPYAEYNEQTGNNTDDDRAEGVGDIAGSGDSNKTCKRGVKTHTYVGLAVFNPCENHTCNGCKSGSNGSCKEYGTELLNRGSGCAVEAVPTEPEDKYAECAERDVVAGECADLDYSVFVYLEFTDTGAEDLCADKSGDTADHVDRAGAGEIVEAHLTEPAAAPDPVRFDRIDNSGDNTRVYTIGEEFGSLSHCARNDGRCGSAEHEVEYKA